MKVARGRVLLGAGPLLLLVGCAAEGPPRPPSLNLPKPPADLRAVRKGDRVTLTWSVPTLTTDHAKARTVGSTWICRGTDPVLKECGAPVGEASASRPSSTLSASSSSSSISSPSPLPSSSRGISRMGGRAQKVTASYTDNLFSRGIRPQTYGSATYAVEVLNGDGRGAGLSNQVRVPLAGTLPPPADFEAEVTGRGVVLKWRAAPGGFVSKTPVSYVYRIYRRIERGSATLVGEVPLLANPNLSFTDANAEWEQTYYYHVEAVTVMARTTAADEKQETSDHNGAEAASSKIEIEGDDSAEIKVLAHDVFPPAVPTDLQAVFSGPGQQPAIDLVWAPVTDLDLAGYNIYRREAGGVATKINGELVKAPAYRDASVVAGKTYLYSASAVDVRGNESARSVEAEEKVP